jgi:hypothetical protein
VNRFEQLAHTVDVNGELVPGLLVRDRFTRRELGYVWQAEQRTFYRPVGGRAIVVEGLESAVAALRSTDGARSEIQLPLFDGAPAHEGPRVTRSTVNRARLVDVPSATPAHPTPAPAVNLDPGHLKASIRAALRRNS